MTRLSENMLELFGFEEAIDITTFEEGEKCFRLEIDAHRCLQIKFGDYPDDNPNCGIAGIYTPAFEASGVPEDLYDKEEWSEEDHQRAINHKIQFPEHYQPIAWYFISLERLEALILGLTGKRLQDFSGSYS